MILATGRAHRRAATAAIAAVSLIAGCGGGNGTSGEPGLVATTSIWADIASNVACGETVTSIIPTGADPHAFEASLRDRELLDSASLVVANGADLEESLLDLLDTAVSSGTTVIEMTNHVDVIDDDPHIWLDPSRVAGALDVVAEAIVADGRDEARIERCLTDYRAELAQLDTEIAGLVAAIPESDRVLVTNHDALAYFADRYGFEVLGTVIPSTSSMAETDPATLEALAETIEASDVPAIFVEELESTADAEALAGRLGVEVVPLLTGSLADEGPASTYVGMLRATAAAITGALAP